MHSVKNNAESTLTAGLTADAVSLTITADNFPAVPFWLSIDNEIVDVTAKNGTIFTVTRGADGTTAVAHNAGAKCELNCVAGHIGELQAAIPKTAIINETQPNGTAGGTFTSGAWRTRTLNTIASDDVGVTLNNNQITLPAGKYKVSASAPALQVNRHQIRLQNITDGATVDIGTSEMTSSTSGLQSRSFLNCCFTIDAQKVFEIQHLCATTTATNGLGFSSSLGINEKYTIVEIMKVG